jgi:surface-anchored protein
MQTQAILSYCGLTAALHFTATAPGMAAAVAYTSGHADIGIRYEMGAFEPYLQFEHAVINGIEITSGDFRADGVEIIVPFDTYLILPTEAPFLGSLAGASVWLLPAGNTPGVPFLGWSTEQLDPSEWAGNLTFSLVMATSGSGTGNFAAWQFDSFGSVSSLAMSSAQPASAIGLNMAADTHDHYNLAFTEPGLWQVDLRISGTHATAGAVAAVERFTFRVVPEPSSLLFTPLGFLVALRRRRDPAGASSGTRG